MMEDGRADRAVSGMGDKLAPRELAVAALRLRGVSVQDVAQELGIKPTSVRTTMHRVYRKYNVSSLEQLREIVEEQGDCAAYVSEPIDPDRRFSVGEMASLMLEISYLLCAPIAIAYICFMQSSSLRFHLNDLIVVALMVFGALLSSVFGPVLKRRVVNMSSWMQIAFAFGVLLLLFPVVGQVLVGRILLGCTSTPGGAARFGSYVLCLIVSSLTTCVSRSSGFALLAIIEAHPLIFILTLTAQFLIASWATIEGAIALVVLVATIGSSSFLMCCTGGLRVSGAPSRWKLHERLAGPEMAFPWMPYAAFLVFGMSLGASQLPAKSFLLECASCLPFVSSLAFCVYATHRIEMPDSHLLPRVGLISCVIATVSIAAHSCRLGFLVGAVAAFVQMRRALRVDALRLECARQWSVPCIMTICVGVLVGSALAGVPMAPGDVQMATTLEQVCAGVMFLMALVGIYAMWLLCMMIIDMAAQVPCDGSGRSDDVRRVRALLMLRGMTDYECEVILRTVAGASVQEIADDLHYSASSVKAARGRAYRMFGVHGVTGLKMALSQDEGL